MNYFFFNMPHCDDVIENFNGNNHNEVRRFIILSERGQAAQITSDRPTAVLLPHHQGSADTVM